MNFQGFSPDSFEQFSRALALKVIGPGVTIFGNGPDGGREANFEGKVSFPSPPENIWDGYGVLQAKFKEKLETTQKDQQWAKSQLETELEKWVVNDKREPKPDYFIFCTNVELSSATNGGKDIINQVFKDYKDKIGLKDFAIWDANQLTGYVDGYAEIRQRFECFFTPGDLLAAIAKKLSKAVNPDSVLTAYLCKEILADEDAKLSQAGDRSEDRIRLANVFVDLPVADGLSFEPKDEHFFNLSRPSSLQELLQASAFKLDPLALEEYRQALNNQRLRANRVYGRFVFLGGPGSGKSTIGQFLAQIHRAALLDRREPHRVEYKVRNIIKEIKARCEQEQAFWPTTPRYPFRIELNAFAKALAKKEVNTLSAYLRRHLSQDEELSHQDLREWLGLFPWLLILDGLDEVPSSSNRSEVIAAIHNFLSEARDVEADLMIVASSRPDGYAGEFDGDEVAHKYLQPLSKEQALACAQRYVNAKTASKGDQRAKEAMETLTHAVDNPLIAKLMCSPLQVTFMVTVVAASGKPSDSRWQLFSDYYRIIYERELHKAVPPFDVALSERRSDIGTLHHRVGFILQCRAESSGETQADISIAEFERLVIDCLEENGLSQSELENQKELIIGAANQRLVFLTSRTPGRLSFDVRSLQEYMAAACLTNNADSDVIIQRLNTIAHSAYWRNTLLFAIGRFFVDEHLRSQRDKIRLFCEDLNYGDDEQVQTKLGSYLALEILESGIIGNMPLIIRSLTTCALKLLAHPISESGSLVSRLANIYSTSVENEFQTEIDVWLGQQSIERSLSAWMLVLHLEKKDVIWAAASIAKHWPQKPSDTVFMLSNWFQQKQKIDDLDLGRVERLIPNLSFTECSEHLFSKFWKYQTHTAWFQPMVFWWLGFQFDLKLLINSIESGIKLKFISTSYGSNLVDFKAIKSLSLEQPLHPDWQLLMGIVDYYLEPTIIHLADALEYIAEASEPEIWPFLAGKSPWPLAVHLERATTKAELIAFAKQIRTGMFGDAEQWLIIETKWKNNGISFEELINPLFSSEVTLAAGIRPLQVGDVENENISLLALNHMAKYLVDTTCNDIKNKILRIIGFYGTCKGKLNGLDPNLLKSNIISTKKQWYDRDFIIKLEKLNPELLSEFIEFYDCFGQFPKSFFTQQNWKIESVPLEQILNAFAEDSKKLGLLRLAGFWCAAGRQAAINPAVLFPLEKFQEPKYRLAAMLVRMSQQDLLFSEAEQMVGQLAFVTGENGEPQAFEILVSALEHHAKETIALEIVLKKLLEIIPEDKWQLRARAETLRQTLFEAKPSGFDEAKLKKMNLPLISF